jgi:CRISPR-associated protein Csm3
MLSGLHIGAGRDTIEIGGLDQPVIKHPINNAPYIPGSSMKGKMRSLLETYYFVDREETRKWVVGSGQACGCSLPDCPSCRIFGTSGAQKSEEIGPTRIIVRDALLTEHFFEQFKNNKWNTEVKYENTINRVTGTADNPRPLERVPAGVEFNLNISFKVFENDEPELIDFVYKGLKLIQLDALGGNSSRGCGHVVFKEVKCNGQDIDLEQMTL